LAVIMSCYYQTQTYTPLLYLKLLTEYCRKQPNVSMTESVSLHNITAIQQYIDSLESAERIKHHPHLPERAPNVEFDDIVHVDSTNDEGSNHTASLRNKSLKLFSLSMLNIDQIDLSVITKLDVSNNELSSIPGLSTLYNLQLLNLRRNWFDQLPPDIGSLSNLTEINASRNFLKPTSDSLRLDSLRSLDKLQLLDLRMNQKCRTVEHRAYIQKSISSDRKVVFVLLSIWQEMSATPGCIGSSAAVRDATLLRSQLEPWGTVQLRRRLVRDFGLKPTDPEEIGRAEVMDMLLSCYHKEGLLKWNTNHHNEDDDNTLVLNHGIANRPTIRIDGSPVRQELLDSLLKELQDWRYNNKRGGSTSNRERPSINAECYLILRAPNDNNEGSNSRQEKRRQKKMEHNQHLWNLAMQALSETDPEFSSRCSEIAVTYGFIGSPHIDRQNSSPFYGLSLGNFTEGTGCVAVEISARVVAMVNTKHRLGKVDGRYPHWVSQYDIEKEERYSLIYYDTLSKYQVPGPAIFYLPTMHDHD